MALTSPRGASLILAVAVVAVAVVRLAGPAGAPPLYDGVCVANPYLYLNPPPGAPTTKPTSGKHTVPVQGGVVPGTIVTTDQPEFPPQAQFSTDDGTLIPPAGATQITLTVNPAEPPVVKPADGAIDGNVYHISATADRGGDVKIDPAKPATVTLRTTSATGQAEVVEHFDGSKWIPLQTSPGSCAFFFSAPTTALGDFVVVNTTASTSPSGTPAPCAGNCSSGGVSPVVWIAIAAALVVLLVAAAAMITGVRRRRQRAAAEAARHRRRRR